MKQFFALYLLISICSCTANNAGRQQNKPIKTTILNSQDSQPGKSALDFLNWYKSNILRLNKFQLVNNCPPSDDTTKYYSVNFQETEKYLGELQKSGYVSEKYIDKWRKYFKKCDQDFKANPMYDGPPVGFEFDLILLTQEIDETLDAINNPKFLPGEINGQKAIVKMDILMRLAFHMTKSDGKWLIDDIENLGME